MKPQQKGSQKSAKSTTATSKAFTEEERGAIRDRVQEVKAGKGEGESAVLAKIAEMQEPDRTMAKRLHTIIKENAPALTPRLWYGMPAYAKDEKVVCHFQAAAKFKTRRTSTKATCGRPPSR
jgi:surface antigen